MTKNILPEPAVVAIERTSENVKKTIDLLQSLRQEFKIKILGGDVRQVERAILRTHTSEPCLVVSDQVGFHPISSCLVKRIRTVFRRADAIAFSAGAEKGDIALWKRHRLISAYVPKQNEDELIAHCRSILRDYMSDQALSSARLALQKEKSPFAMFIWIDGKCYSPVTGFREMVCKTKLGMQLLKNQTELERVRGMSRSN